MEKEKEKKTKHVEDREGRRGEDSPHTLYSYTTRFLSHLTSPLTILSFKFIQKGVNLTSPSPSSIYDGLTDSNRDVILQGLRNQINSIKKDQISRFNRNEILWTPEDMMFFA